MATVPDSTQDIFDAFRAAGTDADLAHKACESIRNQAGQNVITHVDARFDTFQANVDARFDTFQANVNARFDVMDARLGTTKAEVNARFDVLEGQVTALATLINRDHLILLGIVATAVIGAVITSMLFP